MTAEGPLQKGLFPTRLSRSRQAAGEYATTAHGCRLATSVGGVLTGRGADLLVVDDPLKPDEAHSAAQRGAVNDWFGSTLLSRLNSKREPDVQPDRVLDDPPAGTGAGRRRPAASAQPTWPVRFQRPFS